MAACLLPGNAKCFALACWRLYCMIVKHGLAQHMEDSTRYICRLKSPFWASDPQHRTIYVWLKLDNHHYQR